MSGSIYPIKLNLSIDRFTINTFVSRALYLFVFDHPPRWVIFFNPSYMKNLLYIILILCSLSSHCQSKDSSTMQINKITKSDSLIVDEPEDDDYEYYKDKVFDLEICSDPSIHRYIINTYCVDEKPFKLKSCDHEGNLFSYVEIDENKGELTLFLIDLKLVYKIVTFESDLEESELFYYMLCDPLGNRIYVACDTHKTFFLFRYPNILITCKIKF